MSEKIFDAIGQEIHEYKYSEIFKKDSIKIYDKIFHLDPNPRAEIMPGDTYLAQRWTGIVNLTCKENDKKNRIIIPVETIHNRGYSYYAIECRRVVRVD